MKRQVVAFFLDTFGAKVATKERVLGGHALNGYGYARKSSSPAGRDRHL